MKNLVASVAPRPEADSYTGSELRMSVHQAAGMVMQQTGGNIVDAIALIRATALAEDVEITVLAREILARARRFGPMEGGGGITDGSWTS